MTALGDRILVMVVVATGLGFVIWWGGFVWGDLQGVSQLAAMGVMALVAIGVLAGIWTWLGSEESDEPAGSEGGRIEDEEEHPEDQTAPGSDVEQEPDDRRR